MAETIVGVMGPGRDATTEDLETAEELGRRIAAEGWVLLTGGRASGVMEAASAGAAGAGGMVVGILPSADRNGMSGSVDIPIVTGLGSARNNVNVLSSDIVMACGLGMGTISEVLLAAKAGKQVILLNQTPDTESFLSQFGTGLFHYASSPSEAVRLAGRLL